MDRYNPSWQVEKIPFGRKGKQLETASLDETNKQRERADRVFSSSDQRVAFEQIGITTLLEQQEMLLRYKKDLVLDLHERGEIDQEVLKKHKTIYLGAGVDIEYPLCLGARKIVLVDENFRDPEMIDIVLDKIIKITAKEPQKISERAYTFFFDFGSGVEEVRVEFAMKEFAQFGDDFGYNIPNKVGLILAFLLESGRHFDHPLYAPMLKKKLIPGGMVLTQGYALDIHTFRDGIENFRKERNTTAEEVSNLRFDDPYFDQQESFIYGKYGFESIRLEPCRTNKDTGKGVVMTFLKKRKVQ